MKFARYLLIAAMSAMAALSAQPCSRIVFRSDSTDIVMIGRTLDWRTPIPTNIYCYPAGMAKTSMPSGHRLEWKSRYGSVLAVGYDGGVTEGMNDQGLVMNGLFCRESVYREALAEENVPVMSLSVLVSFFLDNFATVNEVKSWIDDHDFAISGKTFDGGTVSLLHWALTDRTGCTLIMEYTNGQLNTYMSKDYQVMTNNPTFPEMRAIERYWEDVGGANFLPGSVRSSDRFVRGSYFIHHVPTTGINADMAYTELASVMDNVAVPYGYEVPDKPNLSSTQWRSISDISRSRYYMKFSDSLGTFYIDLTQLTLSPDGSVLKLDTDNHQEFFGCVNNRLIKSEPFSPIW